MSKDTIIGWRKPTKQYNTTCQDRPENNYGEDNDSDFEVLEDESVFSSEEAYLQQLDTNENFIISDEGNVYDNVNPNREDNSSVFEFCVIHSGKKNTCILGPNVIIDYNEENSKTMSNQKRQKSRKISDIIHERLKTPFLIDRNEMLFESNEVSIENRKRSATQPSCLKVNDKETVIKPFHSDSLLTTNKQNTKTKHSRSLTIIDDQHVSLRLMPYNEKQTVQLKQRRSASITTPTALDLQDLRLFERSLSGKKMRSASLIAAQSIIQQNIPIIKTTGYEALAIEAKLQVINECPLIHSRKSSVEEEFFDEEVRKRKIGVCEKDKRDRLLVSTTLQYYQRISDWFIWMLDGFKNDDKD